MNGLQPTETVLKVLHSNYKGTVSCYKIEPATLTGVIVGDVALTVLVVVITYFCASRRRQRKENAENKDYCVECKTGNLHASCVQSRNHPPGSVGCIFSPGDSVKI
uniref:DNAX-activation protein 10 n=1 Tax=Denticeps clupeoides TaxID=299321 RepID=A0AAY4B027_9TELE